MFISSLSLSHTHTHTRTHARAHTLKHVLIKIDFDKIIYLFYVDPDMVPERERERERACTAISFIFDYLFVVNKDKMFDYYDS